MNMKRFLLLALLAVSVVCSAVAERIGTMNIRGVACQYDTLIHRHVGPGVTYTQFQFNEMKIGGSIPYEMRTHLLTIDMTNQYNQLSPYLTGGTYYECYNQVDEVNRQKRLGLKPFASVNGIGFVQAPPLSTDPYTYMESLYNLVHDGLVRYEEDANRVRYYTDASNKGNVGSIKMRAKVTSSKGASAAIGQINHHRNFARKNNTLALFCNGMDKAKDTNPKEGVEVFLQGDEIKVGMNRLVVVQKKAGCGAPIPSGQSVITGVGSDMEAFLNGLEEGETVTIEIEYVDAAGNTVLPSNTYSAFIANCVKNGVACGNTMTNYACSATGVSKDGNTVYLADLEISSYSNAPLRCLEDFLIEIGAWNACYNDGGPSAEMTIDGKFVTNSSVGFGFNGRYIPNGIMVYSVAPDDREIVSVECADPSPKKLNIGDSFTLSLYGYNQYGEMIDEQAVRNTKVEISCPKELGTISSDGKFTANHIGSGVITIGVKNHGTQVSIPINVENHQDLIIYPSNVFTGENRSVQLYAEVRSMTEVIEVDPALIEWSADDEYVVSSCSNGLVVPYMDGYSTITATYQGLSATVDVEVENLEEEGTEYIEFTDQLPSSGNLNLRLPSVPRSIYIETKPVGDETIILTYSAGENEIRKVLENQGAGSISRETINLDYDAADTYPVTVNKVRPATTEIVRLIAVYTTEPYTGISNLHVDKSSIFEFSRSGESLTLINCSSATDVLVSVYSLSGVKLAEKQCYLSAAGSCTFEVKMSEPVIVRVQTNNGVQVYKLAGE